VVRAATGQVEQGLAEITAMLGDAIALGDQRVECECRFAIASRAAADGRFDDALQHLAAGERLMRDGAVDEYVLFRDLWMQRRNYQIQQDGRSPDAPAADETMVPADPAD